MSQMSKKKFLKIKIKNSIFELTPQKWNGNKKSIPLFLLVEYTSKKEIIF